MIELPELENTSRLYAQLEMKPLIVRAHLRPGAQMVNYDRAYLDGLLARAVMDRATGGDGVPDCDEGYWIPLPLKILWRSESGLPLWAGSVFQPVGMAEGDVVYTHKRMPKALYCTPSGIKNNVGRWMDRRLPLPTEIAGVYEARCIGHAATVLDLLADIAFMGKRRSIGFGEVDAWEVVEAEFSDMDTLTRDGALIHAIPAASRLVDCQGALRHRVDIALLAAQPAPARLGGWNASRAGD